MSIQRGRLARLWCACGAIILSVVSGAYGQDPSFSQFYANRIYLNPAFTGIEPGVAVTGVTRMQWLRVDKGFQTYGLTAEMQLPVARVGLGLHLLRNTEGLGNLTTHRAGVTFAYTIPGRNNNFHFGLEGRMVQKNLDWEELVFSDQLDPVYGDIYPSAITPVLDQVFFGDLDFGVVWRNQSDLRIGGRNFRDVRSHFGVSVHHLPYIFSRSAQGNDSFLSLDGRVAPRTTFHGGMIIPIRQQGGSEVALSPNIKLDMQGYQWLSFQENIVVGTVGMFGLVDNFYLGMLYQNRTYAPNHVHTDALIFTIGGYVDPTGKNQGATPPLFFGLSVDLNLSGLGPAAGSVFEATFRYRFLSDAGIGGLRTRGSRSKNRFLDCKKFF